MELKCQLNENSKFQFHILDFKIYNFDATFFIRNLNVVLIKISNSSSDFQICVILILKF